MSKCNLYPDTHKGEQSQLFVKLVGMFNRKDARVLYATMRSPAFRAEFGDYTKPGEKTGRLNKQGEPYVYMDSKEGIAYVIGKDGKRFSIDSLTMRKIKQVNRKTVVRNLMDYLNKMPVQFPEKLRHALSVIGTNALFDNLNWNSLKKGVKALESKEPSEIVSTEAQDTFAVLFKNTITRKDRTELYKKRGLPRNPTDEQVSELMKELAIEYITWKADTETSATTDPEVAEIYKSLKELTTSIRLHEPFYDSMFNALRDGEETLGIPSYMMDIGIGKSAVNIAKSFGLKGETAFDAVNRFKDVFSSFRAIVNARVNGVYTKNGIMYTATFDEALEIAKDVVERISLNAATQYLTKYNQPIQDALENFDTLNNAQKEILLKYFKAKKIYDNFNDLAALAYPKVTAGVKQKRNIRTLELADYSGIETAAGLETADEKTVMENPENIDDQSDEATGIQQETQSSETFDGESNSTDMVKSFVSTINKKGTKNEFVNSRFVYFRLLEVLSRLQIKDKWYGKVGVRYLRVAVKRAFGVTGKDTDIYVFKDDEAIFKAIKSIMDKMETNEIYEPDNHKGHDIEPKGEFVSSKIYRDENGNRIVRRAKEETPSFFKRIMDATGHTNQEIVIASQRQQARDLWNTLHSHFGSMSKSNFKFMKTEKDKRGMLSVQYRSSASQSIGDAFKSDMVFRITEAYMNEQMPDILKEVKELTTNGKPASDFAKISYLLRRLGLNNLANGLVEGSFDASSIMFEITKSDYNKFKKLDNAYSEYKIKKRVFDETLGDYESLSEEERKEAFPRAKEFYNQSKKKSGQVADTGLNFAEEEMQSIATKQKEAQARREQYRQEKIEKAAALGKEYKEREEIKESDLTQNEKITLAYLKAKDNVPTFRVASDLAVFLNDIEKALLTQSTYQRATSVLSKNIKKYLFSFGSNAQRNFNQRFVRGDFSIFKSKFFKGEVIEEDILGNKIKGGNMYVAKRGHINSWEDYDYYREKNSDGAEYFTDYKGEDFLKYWSRVFNGMFIHNVNGERYTGKPTMSIPTIISNKTKPYIVNVDVIRPDKMVENIEHTIYQLLSRDKSLEGKIQGYSVDSLVGFNEIQRHLDERKIKLSGLKNKDGSFKEKAIKEIARKIYEEDYRREAEELARMFIEHGVELAEDLVTAHTQSILDKNLYPNNNLGRMITRDGKTKATQWENNQKTSTYSVEDILPLMHAFVANYHLHSFHLLQLAMMDPAFYGTGGKLVKRASGPHAPGQAPSVSYWGMKPEFSILVGNDFTTAKEELRAELESIAKETNSITEEDIDYLIKDKFAASTDVADGALFYMPEFGDQMVRGYGESYGLSDVIKPALFTQDENDAPVMVKAAGFELTDQYCDATNPDGSLKYPGLHNLRNNMKKLGMDTFGFASGVKVGIPKTTANSEYLFKHSLTEDENGNLVYEIDGKKVPAGMEESFRIAKSEDLRLQFNPYHSLDNTVANPTQLPYFVNVMEHDAAEAKAINTAIADLMRVGTESLEDRSNASIIEEIKRQTKGGGTERVKETLDAGVDAGFPSIVKEMFTKVAAMYKKNIIAIRYKNSQKLTARPAAGLNANLEVKVETMKDGTKLYVSDALVPRGTFPKHIEDMIEKRIQEGGEVFANNGDSLIFRIPTSELHSAVVIKIKGFFEPYQSTTGERLSSSHIALPDLLVKVMGYDFDINFFFLINRQYIVDGNNKIVYPGYDNDMKFNPNMKFPEGSWRNSPYAKDFYIAYKKNVVLESFMSAVTKEENILRMVTPISFTEFERDIERLDKIADIPKVDYNVSSPIDQWKAYESSFSGLNGTGATANGIKAIAYTMHSGELITEPELTQEETDAVTALTERHAWFGQGDPRWVIKWAKAKGIDLTEIKDENVKAYAKDFREYKKTNKLDSKSVAPTIRYAEEAKQLKYNGRVLSELKQKSDDVDGKKGLPIWEMLDSMVNSFIDNVNLQIMPRLNINDVTLKAYIAGIALGVDYQSMNSLMLQPVLQRMASFSSGFVRDDIMKRITDKFGEAIEEEDLEISRKELDEALKYAKGKVTEISQILEIEATTEESTEEEIAAYNFAKIQAKAILIYSRLDSVGRDISTISQYLKILKDFDVTMEKIESFMDIRKKIVDDNGNIREGFGLNINKLFESNPHIKAADEALLSLRERYGRMFPIHSEKATTFFRTIAKSLKTIGRKDDLLKRISEDFQKYLLVTLDTKNSFWDPSFQGYKAVPAIRTLGKRGSFLTGKKAYMEHIARMTSMLKDFRGFTVNGKTDISTSLTDNSFLKFLTVETGFEASIIRMIGTTNMEYIDFIGLRGGFMELKNYDYDFQERTIVPYELKPGEKYSPLQKHLLRYALNQYGIQFGTRNFSLIFPPDMFVDISNQYRERVNKVMHSTKLADIERDFVVQFALGNGKLLKELSYDDFKMWNGYNAQHNVYYDLWLPKDTAGTGWENDIVRYENSVFIKVYEDEELGSFYQKVGTIPITHYYEAKEDFNLLTYDENAFKPNIYHTVRDEAVKRVKLIPGMEEGAIVSVSPSTSPARNEIEYYRVSGYEDGGYGTLEKIKIEDILTDLKNTQKKKDKLKI